MAQKIAPVVSGETKKTVGVGLIILDPEMRLYVVEEQRTNPRIMKRSGMLSFPLETQEDRDGGIKGTLHRLIEEETPYDVSDIELLGIHPEPFQYFLDQPHIHTHYAYAKFADHMDVHRHSTVGLSVDGTVEYRGLMHIYQLMNHDMIRVETRPILEHFYTNYFRRVKKKMPAGQV